MGKGKRRRRRRASGGGGGGGGGAPREVEMDPEDAAGARAGAAEPQEPRRREAAGAAGAAAVDVEEAAEAAAGAAAAGRRAREAPHGGGGAAPREKTAEKSVEIDVEAPENDENDENGGGGGDEGGDDGGDKGGEGGGGGRDDVAARGAENRAENGAGAPENDGDGGGDEAEKSVEVLDVDSDESDGEEEKKREEEAGEGGGDAGEDAEESAAAAAEGGDAPGGLPPRSRTTSMYDVVAVTMAAQKWKKKKRRVVNSLHTHFKMTLRIMIGIGTMVRRFDQEPRDADLTMADYEDVAKWQFPPAGTDRTPPHDLGDTFEFKDYAGKMFWKIRAAAGISNTKFLQSLAGNLPYLDFLTNSKSGEFFFFTHDRRFMIKTQPQSESRFLRRFLNRYHRHINDNPDSLLLKLYGLYRIRSKKRTVHFIVMGNVFPPTLQIHQKFDLKGSTQGRESSEREKRQLAPVLKDLDLVKSGLRIHVGQSARDRLIRQLRHDADFLASLDIMDYSLLLGVHYLARGDATGSGYGNPARYVRSKPAVALENLSKSDERLLQVARGLAAAAQDPKMSDLAAEQGALAAAELAELRLAHADEAGLEAALLARRTTSGSSAGAGSPAGGGGGGGGVSVVGGKPFGRASTATSGGSASASASAATAPVHARSAADLGSRVAPAPSSPHASPHAFEANGASSARSAPGNAASAADADAASAAAAASPPPPSPPPAAVARAAASPESEAMMRRLVRVSSAPDMEADDAGAATDGPAAAATAAASTAAHESKEEPPAKARWRPAPHYLATAVEREMERELARRPPRRRPPGDEYEYERDHGRHVDHVPLFRPDGSLRSAEDADEPCLFYCGIIDFLQHYTLRKKVEHFAKSIQYDSLSISAVSPQVYADRFVKFLSEQID